MDFWIPHKVVNREYLICCTIYKYSLGVIPDSNASGWVVIPNNGYE